METITISKTYKLKWQITGYENYKVSPCGKIFNVKSGKEIKRTLNGSTVGFWIKDKFFTLEKLRKLLIKIEYSDCPF